MDARIEDNLRKQFVEILYDLAKSQDVLSSKARRSAFYLRLESLYGSSKFRHYYSDIFSVLTSLQQDNSLGSIDTLGQNMNIIVRNYQAINKDDNGNPIDISNQLKKLYDHISLDIARITYSDAADRRISQNESFDKLKSEINRLRMEVDTYETKFRESQEAIAQTQGKIADSEKAIAQTQEKIADSEKAIENTQKKIEHSEKQYVAILGIFASVVLTFIGGITFSTSVLQNIHQGSIYRIVFVCLVIGIVLIDVLYLLFYFIFRIVKEKRIFSIRAIIIINAVILLLMGLVVLGWKIGFVEKRDAAITDNGTSSIVETQPFTDNSTHDEL